MEALSIRNGTDTPVPLISETAAAVWRPVFNTIARGIDSFRDSTGPIIIVRRTGLLQNTVSGVIGRFTGIFIPGGTSGNTATGQ
jgi:hypothetical protein